MDTLKSTLTIQYDPISDKDNPWVVDVKLLPVSGNPIDANKLLMVLKELSKVTQENDKKDS